MDFVDGSDLALLLNQHAGLQLNHLPCFMGGHSRSVGALRLQIDARRKPPPHQASANGDQQQAAQDLQPHFRKQAGHGALLWHVAEEDVASDLHRPLGELRPGRRLRHARRVVVSGAAGRIGLLAI